MQQQTSWKLMISATELMSLPNLNAVISFPPNEAQDGDIKSGAILRVKIKPNQILQKAQSYVPMENLANTSQKETELRSTVDEMKKINPDSD